MFLDLISHEYFWLSFFPLSFLGIGFWFLFIEREQKQKEPLSTFIVALGSGVASAFFFQYFQEFFITQHFFIKVLGEEASKALFSILAMEIFRKQFKTLSGGIIYGFSIGLGFALAENIAYLASQYEAVKFSADFWITFQGRFWSSTLLHGITMAIFGLFYAGAFLSPTIYKPRKMSPLSKIFTTPSVTQFIFILTFHISRKHLLFKQEKTLTGHSARATIIEGFMVAVLIHTLFNLALNSDHIVFAFIFSTFLMIFLKNIIRKINKDFPQASC